MKKALILVLILAALLVLTTGCVNTKKQLPKNVTNVVQKGNGWVEFTLDGNTYLFYSRKRLAQGYSAITQIK